MDHESALQFQFKDYCHKQWQHYTFYLKVRETVASGLFIASTQYKPFI
jgi:hypothetical protein